MKKNYIYITINERDGEVIGANITIEGTAKMIKEYVEDGRFSDIEIYLDKLIEALKESYEKPYGVFFGENLIEGTHYQTYIIKPAEERTLHSLTVTKVLLEK